MAETIRTAAMATDLITSGRKIVDMRDAIFWIKPEMYPFSVILSRMDTAVAKNAKFEFLTKKTFPYEASLSAQLAGGVTATGTPSETLTLQSGEAYYFKIGDIVHFPDAFTQDSTACNAIVTSVAGVASDEIVVQHLHTPTGADPSVDITSDGTNLDSGDLVWIVGSSFAEGSGRAAERNVISTAGYNFAQIFKETIGGVTGTLRATDLYGPEYLTELRVASYEKHCTDIEKALLFGARSLNTDTAGAYKWMTGGLQYWLTATMGSDVTDGGNNALTMTDLNDFAEGLYAYNASDTKVCFAGSVVIKGIQTLAIADLITTTKETIYGINITKIITPFGDLNIIRHPLMKAGVASTVGYSEVMFGVDLDDVRWRYMNEAEKGVRDRRLETNIQDNDSDERIDQYLTQGGLELMRPECHAKLTNVT